MSKHAPLPLDCRSRIRKRPGLVKCWHIQVPELYFQMHQAIHPLGLLFLKELDPVEYHLILELNFQMP